MTTCTETRTLIACRPLDALEEDELVLLDTHLDTCATCRVRATELGAAYRLLEPEEQAAFLPERLWSEISARLDDPEGEAVGADPASGSELPIALVCTFCHDALVRTDARYCASCLAPHHADCFRTHGRCSTLGCEETHTVRPELEVLEGGKPNTKPRRRWRRYAFPAIGVLIGAGVAAVAVNEAFEARQFARYRAMSARVEVDLLKAGMEPRTSLREFHALQRRIYLGARVSPEKRGLRVSDVAAGGLGKRAGLQKGDLIVRVNGRRVETLRQLQRRLRSSQSSGNLLVRRPGNRKRLRLTLRLPRRLGDRPPRHHMRAQVHTFKSTTGLLGRTAQVQLEVDHDGNLSERRFQVWKRVGLPGSKPLRTGYVRIVQRVSRKVGWDLPPRWSAEFVQSSTLPRPALLQRQGALWLKGPIARDPSTAMVLIDQLRDGKTHATRNDHLVDQLEAIGRAAIDPLCESLRDRNRKAPGSSAWALASVLRFTGSREPLAIELLGRAAKSTSEYVRGKARAGLEALAAQDRLEGRGQGNVYLDPGNSYLDPGNVYLDPRDVIPDPFVVVPEVKTKPGTKTDPGK